MNGHNWATETVIYFDEYNGLLFINFTINPRVCFNFFFSTGAIMSPKFAKKKVGFPQYPCMESYDLSLMSWVR